jgi:cell division protein FtsI (penicillin-binding protein 3)
MEQRNPRLRWLFVSLLAAIWILAVLARLSYLQLFSYGEYLAKAQHQQQRVFEISPKRGTIYDRKGRELAVSLPMDSVFADPAEVTDPDMVGKLLARVLDTPAEELETKIREARVPVRLAKKLNPDVVDRIQGMNLRGVFFLKESRRVYPQRQLAAHVLGFTDVDEKGMGGVEYSLDKAIRGRPGKMMVMADGKRRWYDRREAAPGAGASIVLTIDETVQYIAEKELQKAIEETHAKAGTVVVQNPSNGELLAVANYPTFDPNEPGSFSDESRMDRAVSAAYEPGSTFKVITLAGAIENGVTNPAALIDCQMGRIVVAGRLIHDWHPFGVLTVDKILMHSSDVGAIKVALQLGSPRFYETIRKFGIGQPTGIELPGENRGLLRPVERWTPSSIGSVAMGQEVSVTPIQIISAISAIANGGTLYKPRIVRDIRGDAPGVQRPDANPQEAVDEKTAADMRGMMEDVVLEGTGKPAQLNGYTAAGKSGTAQKIDPATGRYSATQYNSSFAGFAPVNEPAVSILVVLDSPVGAHHGGEVGGPVFKRVAEQVLTYLAVPHDIPTPSDVETAKNTKGGPNRVAAKRQEEQLAAAERVSAAMTEQHDLEKSADAHVNDSSPQTVAFSGADGIPVPSLTGRTVRAVSEECERVGLVPALVGSGVAVEQFPGAGSLVPPGSRVTVRFGRPGVLLPTAAHGAQN